MVSLSCTCLPSIFATAVTREEVAAKARELGVVRRSRKVEAYGLLMAVVLGLSVRGSTVLARLHRVWCRLMGQRLARSAFWDRLTVQFLQLVKWLLDRLVAQSRERAFRPPGKLSQFRDVLALDSSVVQVHKSLKNLWPGTRTNSGPSAIKVHALVRVFTGELMDYQLSGERLADCKAFGVSHRLSRCLVLLDQGYSSPSLWRRVANVGGYSLTRLPRDRDPLVVADNRPRGGRARRLTDRPLKQALRSLKRDVVDVNCTFRCTVRKYRSAKNHRVEETFRVVALRNPKTGRYTLFVTNVSPKRLPAELVGRAYRLRWEVELFFKAGKSGLGLHELPTTKPHIVQILVYAALIRVSACMQDRIRLLAHTNHPRGPDVGPQRWLDWWRQQVPQLLAALLGKPEALSDANRILLLADPNRKRPTNRGLFGFWQEAP